MEILLTFGAVFWLLTRRRAKRARTADALGQVLETEAPKRAGKVGRWKVGDQWL